jgi:sialate O-acetylesterase
MAHHSGVLNPLRMFMMRLIHTSLFLALALVTSATQAAVRLPQVFGDNMVLQRNVPVPVWGWAEAGERVTVAYGGQTKQTVAGPDGTWRLHLNALDASSTPAVFRVSGSNQIELTNVVVGEVWFCSGQSNMAWSMNQIDNSEAEIAAAQAPLIRHFRVGRKVAAEPVDDVTGSWEVTAPDRIAQHSAVAYFFGRRLHEELDVPVGLINSSWGGTRIEPWTPVDGFAGFPQLSAIRDRLAAGVPSSPKHQQLLGDYISSMRTWIETAESGRAALSRAPSFPAELILIPEENPHQTPTVLYNGMVAGLVPFAIRGAIWYQGESNRNDGMLYLEKTEALVQGWRDAWGLGDFPYYAVQLAPFIYGGDSKVLPGIWEAQAHIPHRIRNSGYTVINDIGDLKDIHPTNKQDVGLRLANQALARTYGRKEIRWSGPVYTSFAIEGTRLRISFDHAEGLSTRDGESPTWFELCGPDGLYVAARAVIDGETVVLTAEGISKPRGVRFAWDQTAEPNLINRDGLPTGAFRDGILPKLGDVWKLPELEGFRRMYEINLSPTGHFAVTPPQYRVDESKEAGAFERVAYTLELERPDGFVEYVLASMDAFTADAAQLGIPSIGSGIVHQARVENLTVRSNVAGVPSLDNSDGGNIEFWGTNYGHGAGLQLPGAAVGKFDFDDTPSGSGTYGSMQVHSWKEKATIFAFNNFNNGESCDIGIGNNPDGSGHPDYTFKKNGTDYSVRRLAVFVQ